MSREHSHRPALIRLLESFAHGYDVTNEPRRCEYGAPDIIITKNRLPIGYLETKDVGKELDEFLKTDQLKRYLEGLPNFIFTNYLEFRWYVKGEEVEAYSCKFAELNKDRKSITILPEGAEKLESLFKKFIETEIPQISSPKELAARMAGIAKQIKYSIDAVFRNEPEGKGSLHDQLKGFREVLLHDLKYEDFADMYAQTICYGLFAAKCTTKAGEQFTRDTAARQLPKTNPFLRKMFAQIAGPELDDRIAWSVDELVSLLNHTKIHQVMEDFGKRTRQEDPVVHFYETFLAAYDPKKRKSRGVYYTPEPVVSYIVRSVDHILKTEFGMRDGLADASKIKIKKQVPRSARNDKSPNSKSVEEEMHRLLILDPAAGTGTFLHGVIDHIYEEQVAKGQKGAWSSYVSQNLLPRLFGFELQMAAYAVCHMKLGLQLEELKPKYEFKEGERLGVYLTNTLEEAHESAGLPLFSQWLAEEANAASIVKEQVPVMVVMGNPPYAKESSNNGQWITNLLRGLDSRHDTETGSYFKVDGEPLGERNPKWLNDDYVKFIRFAQWRIEQTGYGILAFISNHGYLDNPTFRGMRRSLMETFDDIYILDLHGNSKKMERAPDGSSDENVFDIQQGVAIGIFVKRTVKVGGEPGVRHGELWGTRNKKYDALMSSDVTASEMKTLSPKAPHYFFVPTSDIGEAEYASGWLITDVFETSAVGFQTHRDYLVISIDKPTLLERMKDYVDASNSDDEIRSKYFSHITRDRYPAGDTRDWKLASSRRGLQALKSIEPFFTRCIRSPFDFQHYFYHPAAIDYGRPAVMNQLIGHENVALLWTRPMSPKYEFSVLASNCAVDQSAVGNKAAGAGGTYVAPLWIKATDAAQQSFLGAQSAKTNFCPAFIHDFQSKLQVTYHDNPGPNEFGPEDVFHYTYAVFHSPTYRTRYAEFLKIDFPRLPLTSDANLFRALCKLGEELVGLHLLEEQAKGLTKLITEYPHAGSDEVGKGYPKYFAPNEQEPGTGKPLKQGRVYINGGEPAKGDFGQYFEGVSPEVWNFHIGGYQVCEKWLKDRRGRTLTNDDITHYQKTVKALSETIRIMTEIDAAIPSWPIR